MAVLEADDLVLLTETYFDQLDALAAATGAELRSVLLSLDHLNRADVERYAEQATPYFRAGRSEAIDLTAGYLSETTGEGRLGIIDLAAEADVLAPFLRQWHLLKEGQAWEEARASAATQAEMSGYDHVQQGAADRMAKPGTKVRGYRRVLSPGACEWCQVVSTQLYKSAESARFGHHDCHCKVVAVPLGADPGAAINKTRLADLKASGAVDRASAARSRARG